MTLSKAMCSTRPERLFTGFLEDLAGDLQRRHRRRPARVEGNMGDGCDDLVAREAVVQGPLQVERHLVDAVERDEARDRHQATVARRQGRIFPNVAEQYFVGEFSEMRGDIAEILSGVRG